MYSVDKDGNLCEEKALTSLYWRPAMCLPANAKIEKNESGRYYIKLEK